MKTNKSKKTPLTKLQEGEELVYGRHVITNLLKEGVKFKKIFLNLDSPNKEEKVVIDLANQNGIKLVNKAKKDLDIMTDKALHQGFAAIMPAFSYSSLSDSFNLAQKRGEDVFLVILDGIEDPHNLGAIIRTAEAGGVHGLIIPKHRSARVTSTVLKVSTGAAVNLPIIQVTNLTDTIKTLKDQGVWVFASDMDGQDMRDWDSSGPIAIVIGNEGKGVSRLVKENCDGIVSIPMVGKVESLNASVASGLLIYEVSRDRIDKGSQL